MSDLNCASDDLNSKDPTSVPKNDNLLLRLKFPKTRTDEMAVSKIREKVKIQKNATATTVKENVKIQEPSDVCNNEDKESELPVQNEDEFIFKNKDLGDVFNLFNTDLDSDARNLLELKKHAVKAKLLADLPSRQPNYLAQVASQLEKHVSTPSVAAVVAATASSCESPSISTVDENGNRPKRSQVKNACVNCRKSCKKCDDSRPCQRCIKYGREDTCIDSVRRERKRGYHRGPYNKTFTPERRRSQSTPPVQMPKYYGNSRSNEACFGSETDNHDSSSMIERAINQHLPLNPYCHDDQLRVPLNSLISRSFDPSEKSSAFSHTFAPQSALFDLHTPRPLKLLAKLIEQSPVSPAAVAVETSSASPFSRSDNSSLSTLSELCTSELKKFESSS